MGDCLIIPLIMLLHWTAVAIAYTALMLTILVPHKRCCCSVAAQLASSSSEGNTSPIARQEESDEVCNKHISVDADPQTPSTTSPRHVPQHDRHQDPMAAIDWEYMDALITDTMDAIYQAEQDMGSNDLQLFASSLQLALDPIVQDCQATIAEMCSVESSTKRGLDRDASCRMESSHHFDVQSNAQMTARVTVAIENDTAKGDTLRAPRRPEHAAPPENEQPPLELNDPAAVLHEMKQSAKELDHILQQLCANQSDADDSDDEAYSIAHEEEDNAFGLHGKVNLSVIEYFESIRTTLRNAPTTKTRCFTDTHTDANQASTANISSDAFNGTSFLFAEPSENVTEVEGRSRVWSPPEAMTPATANDRIASYLRDTNGLLPREVAVSIAEHEASWLQRRLSTNCEVETADRLFPIASLVPTIQLDWQRGSRVCKVQAEERRIRREWGLCVDYTVESIVRARVLPSPPGDGDGDTGTTQYGPPLLVTLMSRVFFPTADYSLLSLDKISHDTTIQLSLARENQSLASDNQVSNHAANIVEKLTPLPEFIDVFHWGRFSTAAGPQPVTGDEPHADASTVVTLSKLDITTPLPRNRIVQAACGRGHTLLLNDAGLVFSFGYATDGALGHGERLGRTEVHVSQPRLVESFFDQAIALSSVACGGDDLTGFHSAAVSRDGRVFTWGIGIALGLGSIKSQSTPSVVSFLQRDTEQPSIVSVSCGSGFCVAIDANGVAYSWGKWSDGRLGLGAIPILQKTSRQLGSRRQHQRFQLIPKQVPPPAPSSQVLTPLPPGGTGWRKVDCGDAHCVAISTDSRLFAWGRGTHGQLGTGDVRDATAPVQITTSTINGKPAKWNDVAVGQDWSLAVDSHGAVWSWGAFALLGLSPPTASATRQATLAELLLLKHRQLQQQTLSTGDKVLPPSTRPPRFDWLRPRLIPTLGMGGDAAIKRVSAGSHHAAAVSARGDLFVWGSPSLNLPPTPTLTTPSPDSSIVECVFCGGDTMIALSSGSFLAHAMQRLHRELVAPPDVLLVVAGGQALPAHKVVLARRSPVLRELLLGEEISYASTTMTELLLPQLREDVARVVLEFLYTDNLSTALDPLAFLVRDVQRAAKQLQIPRLATLCRQRLAAVDPLTLLTIDDDDDGGGGGDEGRAWQNTLPLDLVLACGDESWSDLKVVAEGRAIPAHRCLLVARSEYFRALLAFYTHKPVRELAVEESYLGMRRVLQFIYSDTLATLQADDGTSDDDRTDHLLEDLIAADKYGLVRMKQLCEHHICVTVATCVDVLVVADLVHAQQLKHRAMNFVESHLHLLTDTPVLQRLAREFPHLLNELYECIQRHTQHQSMLREWQIQVDDAVRRQQQDQDKQWHATTAATAFPWVPLILVFVFATLYLTVMNAQESDYPVVPMVNMGVIGGLLTAACLGKL